MFTMLGGAALLKWFKDNVALLVIVGAGGLLIYMGAVGWKKQIEGFAVAQQNLQIQAGQLTTLQKELSDFKDSTTVTLQSLGTMKAAIAKIEEDAKKRNTETNRKLAAIQADKNLTPEEKKTETSKYLVQSLRSTYCGYQPEKCPPPASDPPPADKPPEPKE